MPSCAPRTPTVSLCREPDTGKTARSNRRNKRDLDSAMSKIKMTPKTFDLYSCAVENMQAHTPACTHTSKYK